MRAATWQRKLVFDMGVSKNRGTPKWMVYNGNPIKLDDLGVPLFSETSICVPFQKTTGAFSGSVSIFGDFCWGSPPSHCMQ